MVEAFQRQEILTKRISVTCIDKTSEREQVIDFGRVLRDLVCAFWTEFFNGYATILMVQKVWCHAFVMILHRKLEGCLPNLNKTLYVLEILSYKAELWLLDCSYFSIKYLDQDVLLNSFFDYLPPEDVDVLKPEVQKATLNLRGDL